MTRATIMAMTRTRRRLARPARRVGRSSCLRVPSTAATWPRGRARLVAPRAAGSHARVAGQPLGGRDEAALARLEAETLAR